MFVKTQSAGMGEYAYHLDYKRNNLRLPTHALIVSFLAEVGVSLSKSLEVICAIVTWQYHLNDPIYRFNHTDLIYAGQDPSVQ